MNTAQRILDAAEAELLESDPGSLRVDRVAQASGVNKRMIYHYFSDRSGLLEAVYALQLQRLLAPAAPLAAGSKEVLKALLGERAGEVPASVDPSQPPDSDPEALQSAARVLLPRLLNEAAPADAGGLVSTSAWVCFCVDMVSLAFARQAPVRFPEEPGSQGFKQVSERLLTGSKARLRIRPDSRTHQQTAD